MKKDNSFDKKKVSNSNNKSSDRRKQPEKIYHKEKKHENIDSLTNISQNQEKNKFVDTLSHLQSSLNISLSELKHALLPLIFSDNPETNLYDFLGPSFIDEIGTILKNKNKLLDPNKSNDSKYYTEIVIPPTPIIERQGIKNPYKIFPYKYFNPIQSAVLKITQTENNFLLAAPTGSGKTDVACLCILQNVLLSKNKENSRMNECNSQQNTVYVVPLRALATEITKKLREKFSCINCTRKRQKIDHFITSSSQKTNNSPSKKKKSQLMFNSPDSDENTFGFFYDFMKSQNTEFKCKGLSLYGFPCQDVMEYTGDTPFQPLDAKIIVTTPEKIDACSRKLSFSFEFNLLILDEIHLLEEERGAVIEALVSRYLYKTRIVGLSATVTNTADVGEFIKGPVFHFDDTYRQVPLKMHLIGGKSEIELSEQELIERRRNYFIDDSNLLNYNFNNISLEKNKPLEKSKKRGLNNILKVNNFEEILVEKLLLLTGQSLIFVNSRYECYKTAALIIRRVILQQNNVQKKGGKNPRDLSVFLSHGVGIHNAGMSRYDRQIVEKKFLSNTLKYVVCTKTLAWGLNMPAQNVILYGTKYYSEMKWNNVSLSDVLQIVGRAGRIDYANNQKESKQTNSFKNMSDSKNMSESQKRSDQNKSDNNSTKRKENLFDFMGIAYIITDDLQFYIGKLKNKSPIESNLLNNLINVLNSQIGLEAAMTVSDCIEWYKKTFLYIRACKSPQYYGLHSEITLENESQNQDINNENNLRNLINLAITKLKSCNLITKTDPFQSTWEGRIASYYYIDFKTLGEMVNFLKEDISPIYKKEFAKSLNKISPDLNTIKLNGDVISNEQFIFDSIFMNFISLFFTEQELKLITLLLNTKEFQNITVRGEESELIFRDVMENHKINEREKNTDVSFSSSNISVSSLQKLLFLLYRTIMDIESSLYSLVSDTQFLNKNLIRLISAFEQVSLVEEEYDTVRELFLLRVKISKIKHSQNKKSKTKDCQKSSCQLNRSNSILRAIFLKVNNVICTRLEIDTHIEESFFVFIYDKNLIHVGIIHKKGTFYFPNELKKIRVEIFAENNAYFFSESAIDVRKNIKETFFNIDHLIPYKLFYKRERLSLIENDTKRMIDNITGKILVITPEYFHERENITICKPDALKVDFYNHVIVMGCFTIKLMIEIQKIKFKEITILERSDICEFLDFISS